MLGREGNGWRRHKESIRRIVCPPLCPSLFLHAYSCFFYRLFLRFHFMSFLIFLHFLPFLSSLLFSSLIYSTFSYFSLDLLIPIPSVHYDMDRLFCSKCGANHLSRVGASVNAKTGELRLHLKANYVVNTLGTYALFSF